MVILGIILIVLAIAGVARALLLPLGTLLLLLGIVFDLMHFIGHTFALVF